MKTIGVLKRFDRFLLEDRDVYVFSPAGNLQRIPACLLGEGLLLCKTVQREKLSTRF